MKDPTGILNMRDIWNELEKRIMDLRRSLLENISEKLYEAAFEDLRRSLLEIFIGPMNLDIAITNCDITKIIRSRTLRIRIFPEIK